MTSYVTDYLVIFFQNDEVRVRCDSDSLRLTIMNEMDNFFQSCLTKKPWEVTHMLAEGGFFKVLLTKGPVDKTTMKRKLDKKKNSFTCENICDAVKIEGVKYDGTKDFGSRSVITFTYNKYLNY